MKHKNYFYQIVVGIFSAMVLSTSHAQTNVFDDVIATSPDHNYLEAALVQQGLDVALQTTPNITVFAPTDAAFAKLPKETLESLLKPENKGKLANILTYHVVAGKVPSKAVSTSKVKMVNGQKASLKVENKKVTINGANVVAVDVMASNGVIHVIDSVILPPKK